MAEDGMTEEEAQAFLRDLAKKEDNNFSFFTNVIKADDTTRIGNLAIEELGLPSNPLRALKELELFSREVWKQDAWADFFKQSGQNLTATSLSKDAILLKLAVTKKSEVADMTPKQVRKENKGWFKKRNQNGGQSE